MGQGAPVDPVVGYPNGGGAHFDVHAPSGLNDGGKVAYASITYILITIVVYTVCNLSYNNLLGLATLKPSDRVSMISMRFVVTMSVILFINYSCMSMVKRFCWTDMACIFSAVAIVLLLITFFGIKERISTDPRKKKETPINMSVDQSFSLLFKNKYFLLLTLVFVANYIILGMTMGAKVYYALDGIGKCKAYGYAYHVPGVAQAIRHCGVPLHHETFGWKCQ